MISQTGNGSCLLRFNKKSSLRFTNKLRKGAIIQPKMMTVPSISLLSIKLCVRCKSQQMKKSTLQMNARRDKNKSPFIKNFIQNTINLLHLIQ